MTTHELWLGALRQAGMIAPRDSETKPGRAARVASANLPPAGSLRDFRNPKSDQEGL